MLHYRYREYRTMRHPGREMSDPSDLRASQWLTQICGLGQPVAVASRGPPRQISQQMDCGPRHRRQRREELTACREMVLRERVPGRTTLRAVVQWAAADLLCEAHTSKSNGFSYGSNLAS